jgi:Fusaric acid resistance protein-like
MSSLEARRPRTPERSTRHTALPSWPQAGTAVVECVVLAVACLVTYWLATHLLSRVHSVGRDDDLLGGMWAVLATIFLLRDSFSKSVAAAVSRMAATSVSFVFCLIYLAFLPFHAWALAVLVGASALAVMLLGRPGDAVTAGITTAVIMVVTAVSPQHAWEQPILRLVDTVVGVAVGVIAALIGIQVKRLLPARDALPAPPESKIDLPERAMVSGVSATTLPELTGDLLGDTTPCECAGHGRHRPRGQCIPVPPGRGPPPDQLTMEAAPTGSHVARGAPRPVRINGRLW